MRGYLTVRIDSLATPAISKAQSARTHREQEADHVVEMSEREKRRS